MAIGVIGKHKLYIVRYSDEPSFSESDYIDYTNFFMTWKIRHKVGQVASFEGVCGGINDRDSPLTAAGTSKSGTRLDDIKTGNILYVYSGTTLVSKFQIDKPIFQSDFLVKVIGSQSTGSFTSANKKKLLKTNTPKVSYKQETLSNVLTGSTPYGVLVDTSGNDIIQYYIESDTQRNSFSFDYLNRLESVKKTCNVFRKEWIIDHVNGNDVIRVKTRVGDSSGSYNLILKGTNQNANICSGTEETDSTVNHVIIEGRDINGKQIQSELYDSTSKRTTLSSALDGWLAEDVSPTETSITLKPGHGFSHMLSYQNFYVQIDSELLKCQISGDVLTCARGQGYYTEISETTPSHHKDGSDVILFMDPNECVEGSTARVRLRVLDASIVSSGDTIRVGSEDLEAVYISGGTGILVRRVSFTSGSWANTYAHSAGAIVINGNYTPDSPQQSAGTNSIYDNGLISKTITDNSALNVDALDKKSMQYLYAKEDPVKMITVDVSDPITVWSNLSLGDRVYVKESSKTVGQTMDTVNLPVGYYRVTEYVYEGIRPKLVLYIGDESVRGYNIGSTDFIQSYDESSEEKRQQATRGTDNQRYDLSSSAGGIDSWSALTGKITNVVVPKSKWGGEDPLSWLTSDDDNAAANIGWVKSQLSGSGPGGLWTQWGTALYPWTDRDIIPFTESVDFTLGRVSQRWGNVYSLYGNFEAANASGAVVKITSTGEGDSLRVGYSTAGGVDPEGWNLRVSNTWCELYNGPLAFDHLNPYYTGGLGLIRFYSTSTAWSGFRSDSGTLEYTEDSGVTWNSLGVGLWSALGDSIRPYPAAHVTPNGLISDLGKSSNAWRCLYLSSTLYMDAGSEILWCGSKDASLKFRATTEQFDFSFDAGRSFYIENTSGASTDLYLKFDPVNYIKHSNSTDVFLFKSDGTGSVFQFNSTDNSVKLGGDSSQSWIVFDSDQGLFYQKSSNSLFFQSGASNRAALTELGIDMNNYDIYNINQALFKQGAEEWSLMMNGSDLQLDKVSGSGDFIVLQPFTSEYLYFYSSSNKIYGDATHLYFRDANTGTTYSLADLAASGSTHWTQTTQGAFTYLKPSSGECLWVDGGSHTDNDFMAGKYGGAWDQFNFRVCKEFVGIYNSQLSLTHHYGVCSIGYGTQISGSWVGGIQLDTRVDDDTWAIYGGINNLIIKKRTGSVGYVQFDNHVIMTGIGPSKAIGFDDGSVLIYRLGNDLMFGDHNASVSDLTLTELYEGPGLVVHNHWDAASGGGSLSPSFISMQGQIDMNNNTIREINELNINSDSGATWTINGKTNNLVFSNSAPGSTKFIQFNEDILMQGSSPSNNITFHSASVRIYRNGNNLYFEDLTANSGNPITLTQLFSGGLSDHTHSATGDGGGALVPTSVSMNGAISMNGNNITSSSSFDITSTGTIEVEPDGSLWLESIGSDTMLWAFDDVDIYGAEIILESATDDISFLPAGDLVLRNSSTSCRFQPYYSCTNDIGTVSKPFDDIRCDNLRDNQCDLAELQFVADDVEEGDIVELCDWDTDEEKTFFEKECIENLRLNKMNPHKSRITYIGLQGKWKKSGIGSTRCPSVVSLQPGVCMGMRENREQLYRSGKMKFITLSGSVPLVYIEGKFGSGDILISAGAGHAKVDNDAVWNKVIGYAKRTGKDERCEIWVK